MKTSKKLVFFGTEDFSLPSLKALVEHDFTVVAVVTKPDSARGRSKELIAPVVKTYALTQNIPVLQPEKLGEYEERLRELGADAAVLVSYGKLLPERILNVFNPIGVINVHPSLLPRYRGPSPIEAAIVHADTETGISIMRLTKGMDEGPVYAQKTIPLDGLETRPVLTASLAQAGAAYLVETLPHILSGELIAKTQQTHGVSYTTLLTKDIGILDPLTDTAHALERKVRAYLNFPKSRLTFKNIDVIITSAKVVSHKSVAPLVVDCADQTFLSIEELIAPSGKRMSGEAFLRGYSPTLQD